MNEKPLSLTLLLGVLIALSGCAGGEDGGVGEAPAARETSEPASPEPLIEADLEEICVQQGEVPGRLEQDGSVSGPSTLEETFDRAALTAPADAQATHVAGHYVLYGDRAGVATSPDEVTVVACSVHLFESTDGAASAMTALVEGSRPGVDALGGIQEPLEGLGEEAFVQSGVFQGTSSVAFIWRRGPAFIVVAVTGGTKSVTRDTVRRQVGLVDARVP